MTPRLSFSRVVAAVAIASVTTSRAGAQACDAPPAPRPQLPAVIPIQIRGNHVAFTVCRGNRPLDFVLDTGAGNSIFDLNLAKEMGVSLRGGGRANGGGAGSVEMSQVDRDSVFLPGVSIVAPITSAIDFAGLTGASGSTMQGILGADFIARYIVAIDYRNLQMRLYDRASFKYSGNGTTVPVTFRGAFIFVNADVALSDGTKIPGTFVIDVGSGGALALSKPFVESNNLRSRVGQTMRRPGGRGVGGVSIADIGRVEALSIGGVTVPRPITSLYGDSAGVFSNSSLGDGNIGGEILRRYTVFFDYRAKTMTLEPHEGTTEPFEADMSGLNFISLGAQRRLAVDFVLKGSPADEAGLIKGDSIISIDGETVNASMLDALRRRLRKEGEQVAVTVRRNGADVVLRFVTRRLV